MILPPGPVAIAIDPVNNGTGLPDGSVTESVSGVQRGLAAVALMVFQTPPPAVATKMVLPLASVGSAAKAVIRPVSVLLGAPGSVAPVIGAGPIGVQEFTLSGTLVDNRLRSSSCSRWGANGRGRGPRCDRRFGPF